MTWIEGLRCCAAPRSILHKDALKAVLGLVILLVLFLFPCLAALKATSIVLFELLSGVGTVELISFLLDVGLHAGMFLDDGWVGAECSRELWADLFLLCAVSCRLSY